MNQLYELKEIQSEDDLPKEEGGYTVCTKDLSWGRLAYFGNVQSVWMESVHSYFSPVLVEKETVYVKSDDYHDTQLYLRSDTYFDWVPDSYLKQSEVLIVKQ